MYGQMCIKVIILSPHMPNTEKFKINYINQTFIRLLIFFLLKIGRIFCIKKNMYTIMFYLILEHVKDSTTIVLRIIAVV